MVKSMTAFARSEEKVSWGAVEIELRSVNHRFLEMNLKLPEELRVLEMAIRERIKKVLKRGKVDVVIRLHMNSDEQSQISFDKELATQLANTLHEIDKLIYNAAPVNAVDILSWPGVQSSQKIDPEALENLLMPLLDKVLQQLIESKKREGDALQQMIEERIEQMRELIVQVRSNMPDILLTQRQRLEERLKTLKAEMDNDRLEQEMVYIAQKADVAEEIDRLDTHLDEINRVMSGEETIGRRLDFLMQELNREANTLGSKSIANVTTQASVDLKVLIEQMREQIQNIE